MIKAWMLRFIMLLMEIRIECDHVNNGVRCGKLLFKIVNGRLQIKCRNSKCKAMSLVDLSKLLEISKKGGTNARRNEGCND